MTNRVNIGETKDSALFVDAAAISALQYQQTEKQNHLAIFYADHQNAEVYDLDQHGTDIHTVIHKLQDAGLRLTALPAGNGPVQMFVSPKDIVYATASAPNPKNNGKSAFILGVRGLGRYECDTGVDPKIFDDLMQDVAAQKSMREYKPHIASASWIDAGQLLIDPAAVCMIKDNAGFHFHIFFEGAGSLQVEAGNLQPKTVEDIVCDLLNAKDATLSMTDAFNEARKIHKQNAVNQETLRGLFADDIARQNQGLISLPSEGRINYIRQKDLLQCLQKENGEVFDLEIHVAIPHAKYPEFIRLHYQTAEDRRKTYNILTGQKPKASSLKP